MIHIKKRDKIIRLRTKGVQQAIVAKEVGVCEKTVYNTMKRHKLGINQELRVKTPRTIAPAGATAPVSIEIRNIQNNRQAVRKEISSNITNSDVQTLIMRRDIQLNSENLRNVVEETDKIKEEVNKTKEDINEIKESTENSWILGACINDMYNRIKKAEDGIELLQMGFMIHSNSINNSNQSVIVLPQII